MRYRITVRKEVASDNWENGEIDFLRSVGDDYVFEFTDVDFHQVLKNTFEKLGLDNVTEKDLYIFDQCTGETEFCLGYDCTEMESDIDDWCHEVPDEETLNEWKAGKINLIAAYYRFKIEEIRSLTRSELEKFGFKY